MSYILFIVDTVTKGRRRKIVVVLGVGGHGGGEGVGVVGHFMVGITQNYHFFDAAAAIN